MASTKLLNISGFLPESITDGPGVRSVLFLQGCSHHCKGCHNPETWSYDKKNMMAVDTLFNTIITNKLVKGVTFSGGEPMDQSDVLIDLARLLKDNGYNLMMYTGYTFEDIADSPIFEYIDYVVDGEFKIDLKSYDALFRGSSNQRIIDVRSTRSKGCVTEVNYETFGADII